MNLQLILNETYKVVDSYFISQLKLNFCWSNIDRLIYKKIGNKLQLQI